MGAFHSGTNEQVTWLGRAGQVAAWVASRWRPCCLRRPPFPETADRRAPRESQVGRERWGRGPPVLQGSGCVLVLQGVCVGVCFWVGASPAARVDEVCPRSHRYALLSRGSAGLPTPTPNSLSPIFIQPPGQHCLLLLSHPLDLEPWESPRPQSLNLFFFYLYSHP